MGGATGLGIDPGYRADKGRGGGGDRRLNFIVGTILAKYEHHQCGCSPLPSYARTYRACTGIPPLNSTSSPARIMIPGLVFETPDAKRVLKEAAFWDIYYEHCSYFSPGAHARVFRQEGFDVTGSKFGLWRPVYRTIRQTC